MNSKQEIAFVNIHGNPVPTVLHEGKPYVGMKALCEQMGLDWRAQRQRIKRDPNLSKGVVIITTPSNGGEQEMNCLSLEMINGWLFGIDASRVKPEIRETVLAYQRECYAVLYNYWHGKGAAGILTATDEIRYMNQRLALLRELRHERDPLLREKLHEQFKTVSDRLGYDTPALDAFAPRDPNDALDERTRQTLARFWAAVETLEQLGVVLNHSRASDRIAINLNEALRLAEEHGVAMPGRIELLRALPQSCEPCFMAASHSMTSNLRGRPRTVRCYLFRKTAV